jgi:acetyltransferase EpsM
METEMLVPVKIPLINPNEPDALLVELHVETGQLIGVADFICTLETTKSTAEVYAESEGYVIGLQTDVGDTVSAGEVLCYLAPSPETEIPVESLEQPGVPSPDVPQNLRISQPALALVQEHNLDLAQFPPDTFITASIVGTILNKTTKPDANHDASEFDSTAIIIYGGGGHGKAVLDLLRGLGTYRIVGFVDDGLPAGSQIMGVPILGGSTVLPDLYAQGTRLAINAVGGIGNISTRIKVFEQMAAVGFVCPAIVHPSAVVEPSAVLAAGVQVFPLAYVGSEAQIGYGAIVNTNAVVSHDCVLANYVNISPGAILAGEVQVETAALVGMGVTVNLQVRLGAGARVGNGATVKADVPAKGIVGAGKIWPMS